MFVTDQNEELRALHREAISGGKFGPSPTDFQQSLNAGWKIVNALPRLLAERDALKHDLEKSVGTNTELATENAALREALEKISCPHVTENPLWWQVEARKALKGGGNG